MQYLPPIPPHLASGGDQSAHPTRISDDVVTAYWDGYATVAGQVGDETSVTLQTYSESEYLTILTLRESI